MSTEKNRVKYLYNLAKDFLNLPTPSQFLIGQEMGYLIEEDMVLDPEEIRQYIFNQLVDAEDYKDFQRLLFHAKNGSL